LIVLSLPWHGYLQTPDEQQPQGAEAYEIEKAFGEADRG